MVILFLLNSVLPTARLAADGATDLEKVMILVAAVGAS